MVVSLAVDMKLIIAVAEVPAVHIVNVAVAVVIYIVVGDLAGVGPNGLPQLLVCIVNTRIDQRDDNVPAAAVIERPRLFHIDVDAGSGGNRFRGSLLGTAGLVNILLGQKLVKAAVVGEGPLLRHYVLLRRRAVRAASGEQGEKRAHGKNLIYHTFYHTVRTSSQALNYP